VYDLSYTSYTVPAPMSSRDGRIGWKLLCDESFLRWSCEYANRRMVNTDE